MKICTHVLVKRQVWAPPVEHEDVNTLHFEFKSMSGSGFHAQPRNETPRPRDPHRVDHDNLERYTNDKVVQGNVLPKQPPNTSVIAAESPITAVATEESHVIIIHLTPPSKKMPPPSRWSHRKHRPRLSSQSWADRTHHSDLGNDEDHHAVHKGNTCASESAWGHLRLNANHSSPHWRHLHLRVSVLYHKGRLPDSGHGIHGGLPPSPRFMQDGRHSGAPDTELARATREKRAAYEEGKHWSSRFS